MARPGPGAGRRCPRSNGSLRCWRVAARLRAVAFQHPGSGVDVGTPRPVWGQPSAKVADIKWILAWERPGRAPERQGLGFCGILARRDCDWVHVVVEGAGADAEEFGDGPILPAARSGVRNASRAELAPLDPQVSPPSSGGSPRRCSSAQPRPRMAGHSRIRSATSSGRPGDVMTWPIPGTTCSTAPGIAAARASP